MYNTDLCEAKIDLGEQSTWFTTTPTAPTARTFNLPFYLLEWGYFIAGPEYYTVRNNNRFLIFHTLSGSGILTYEGTTYSLNEGSVAVIWCGVHHEYHTASDTTWEFNWIHYHGAMAHEYFRMIGSNGPAIFKLSNESTAIKLIQILAETTTLNGINCHLQVALHLTELMTILCSLTQEKSTTISREMIDKINESIHYMENNLHKKLTLEEIAKTIFLSKYYYIRVFQKVIGISPYSYLTNLRVNKVKELLILTNKGLSEIADLCGFCDSKNLISNFKKVTGQTTGQYRKSNYGFGTIDDVNSISVQNTVIDR